MPYTVTLSERERSQSGSVGDRGRSSIDYIARGSPDYADILTQVLTDAPAAFNGLIRGNPEIQPLSVSGSGSEWDVTVPYVPIDFQPRATAGFLSYDLSIGGGTRKILHGISVTSYPSPGAVGPNTLGNAINPDTTTAKYTIRGTEISASEVSFDISWMFNTSDITIAYLDKVLSLKDKTNNATFWGCAVGDARLAQARIGKTGSGLWQATFSFAWNKGVTGQTISNALSGNITNVSIGGWEYGFPVYALNDNTNTYDIKPQILLYNVAKVYESGSFTDLGIGTNFPTGAIGP